MCVLSVCVCMCKGWVVFNNDLFICHYCAIFANIWTRAYKHAHTHANLAFYFSQVDVGVVVVAVFCRRCSKLPLWPDFLWQELLEHSVWHTHTHTHTHTPPGLCLPLVLFQACSAASLCSIPSQNEPHLLPTFFYPISTRPCLTAMGDNCSKPPAENAACKITCRCVSAVAQISKMCVTILL